MFVALVVLTLTFSLVLLVVLLLFSNTTSTTLTPTSKMSKMLIGTRHKTLVILLGNARGGNCTWDTLKKHLLQPLDAHLALLFDHERDKDNEKLFEMAKYKWTNKINFLQIWDEAADALGTPHNERDYKRNPASNIHGGLTDAKVAGSGGIIAAFRSVLLRDHSDVVKKYSRVVLTRSDHFYACDHPNIYPDRGVIYVPPDEGYGGITDRHVVFHSHDLNRVVDIVPFLIMRRHRRNIETALKNMWSLNKLTIKYMQRTFFEVKRDEDNTRWSIGRRGKNWEHFNEGIHLKYPQTYNAAVLNCNNKSTLKYPCSLKTRKSKPRRE